MALYDRLVAGVPTRQPAFENYVAGLTDVEQKALLKAAVNPAWNDADLCRILQDEGVIINVSTLAAWRATVKGQVLGQQGSLPPAVVTPTPTTTF